MNLFDIFRNSCHIFLCACNSCWYRPRLWMLFCWYISPTNSLSRIPWKITAAVAQTKAWLGILLWHLPPAPTQFIFYFLIFSAHDIWSYFHIPLPREKKKYWDYICRWLDRAGFSTARHNHWIPGHWDRIRSETEDGAGFILPMGRFLGESSLLPCLFWWAKYRWFFYLLDHQ